MSDQSGSRNPNWRGGVSSNNMRYKRLQKQRYPERVYARELVRRAVRSGRLVRGPCVSCGAVESFAHHADYSKPLEVHWLCRECHGTEHEEHPQPKFVPPAPEPPPDSFVWRGRVRPWKHSRKQISEWSQEIPSATESTSDFENDSKDLGSCAKGDSNPHGVTH